MSIIRTKSVCNGEPRVSGTRLTVIFVLEAWKAAGFNMKELIESYPSLKPTDVGDCLNYACKVTRKLYKELTRKPEHIQGKGTIWKITKHFRGGSTTYQAVMPVGYRMQKGAWKAQLQEWGEHTSGGHEEGWRITAVNAQKPVMVPWRRWGRKDGQIVDLKPLMKKAPVLKFRREYLEKR